MAARVGDNVVMVSPCVGGCNVCPHPWSGIITQGSSNTTANGMPLARKGDQGQCICPHGGTFKIMLGSTDTKNGPEVARIGDSVQCTKCGAQGKIVAGSPNVFANNM